MANHVFLENRDYAKNSAAWNRVAYLFSLEWNSVGSGLFEIGIVEVGINRRRGRLYLSETHQRSVIISGLGPTLYGAYFQYRLDYLTDFY